MHGKSFQCFARSDFCNSSGFEDGTFQLAGKLLTKTRQAQLAREYQAEYAKRGGPFAI